MSNEEKIQQQMLEHYVAGSGTLAQVLADNGIDRVRIARWTADKRFARQAKQAMQRRLLLDQMDITLQQSLCIQQRSKMIEQKLRPEPDKPMEQARPQQEPSAQEPMDPKLLETIIRQNVQMLSLILRQQRNHHRARSKRQAGEPRLGYVHPSLDEESVQRAFDTMDRIDWFLDRDWVEKHPPMPPPASESRMCAAPQPAPSASGSG